MDGDKRGYVLVAGKHQFFPRRELDTIEYSIEDTYKGLYQELRGYLGKPRKTTSDPLPPELTCRCGCEDIDASEIVGWCFLVRTTCTRNGAL